MEGGPGAARTDVDVGSVNSSAQDDDDEAFDAMCEELLEDLRASNLTTRRAISDPLNQIQLTKQPSQG